MKVHSNHFGQPSKKRFIALSCATALASFALFARPVFAEEKVDGDTSPTDNTISASTESIQTTADLVETREVATSQESASTPRSEQAQTATSEVASQTNTSSESQANQTDSEASTQPEASADTSAFRSTTTTAETEPANTPVNTVTDGHYYSDDQGNWYYRDANGNNVTGEQTIDGQQVYFRDNGQQVKGALTEITGSYANAQKFLRYYDQDTGQLWTNRYVEYEGNWYYLGKDGKPLTGEQTIDGVQVYFDFSGHQVKGEFAFNIHYYDQNTGALVTNAYVTAYNRSFQRTETFYLNQNGSYVTGAQTINGVENYFNEYGFQLKDGFAPNHHYYDADGKKVDFGKNRYVYLKNDWYYVDNDGAFLTGAHTIDGVKVYFKTNGAQVKGNFDTDYFSRYSHYYDKDSGAMVTNDYAIAFNNNTLRYERFYFDDKGLPVTGEQTINGEKVYFDSVYCYQIFDNFGENGRYYDQDGHYQDLGKNRYVQLKGQWYYVDNDGKVLHGEQTIDGVAVYFDWKTGQQAKGIIAPNGKYYDKDSGSLITNQWITLNDKTYYAGSDGKIAKGATTIKDKEYYFDRDTGVQIKGGIGNGKFYDTLTGNPVYNQYISLEGFNKQQNWYYFGSNGYHLYGPQTIDGVKVYFNKYNAQQVKGDFAEDGHYYDKDTGALTDLGSNRYVQINNKWYYLDANGNKLTGEHTIDGVQVYFDKNGVQAKDMIIDGYYYDKDNGAKKEVPRNQFVEVTNGLFYFNSEGKPLRYNQVIDGKRYHFNDNGSVLRGEFGYYGYPPYYDKKTGAAVIKSGLFTTDSGATYYFDEKGNKITGLQEIDGKLYCFYQPIASKNSYGAMLQNVLKQLTPYSSFNKNADNSPTYYFGEDGAAVTNRYVQWEGDWYYLGNDGKALRFDQVVDGTHVYFDYEGKQAKGKFISDYKGTRYYDQHTGALVTNQTRNINGQTYHFDADGRATIID